MRCKAVTSTPRNYSAPTTDADVAPNPQALHLSVQLLRCQHGVGRVAEGDKAVAARDAGALLSDDLQPERMEQNICTEKHRNEDKKLVNSWRQCPPSHNSTME
jgi:hypothetical protein